MFNQRIRDAGVVESPAHLALISVTVRVAQGTIHIVKDLILVLYVLNKDVGRI